ncbi:MAG: SUF system NifU family Fe-S cluster assembly protein [Mariprofundaceae bacterium]|nr:SUF system NifU family Fe-S cluster assembly protein [Mariprofundaceae bacterium]
MFDLRSLYQQVIVDHSKAPRHFGVLTPCSHDADGHNPLCGDHLHVYLQVANDGQIVDASFEGEGCAISVASASMMTEAMIGHTVTEFEALFDRFQKMVTSPVDEALDDEAMGKLAVLGGVREFPSRIKCAILCWHTVKSAITAQGGVAHTE